MLDPRMVYAVAWFAVLAGCSSSAATGSGQAAQHESEPTPSVAPEPPPPAPASTGFERFAYTYDETPCPPQARGDCHGSAELLADGTLRMDPWGSGAAAPLSAQVPETERAAAIAAVTAPALLTLLAQPEPCTDANQTETMLVRISGADRRNMTGYCNDAPIQAARRAMMDLTSAHFPDHSLITPPF